jgi:DNA replication protein DnaC
MKQKPNDGVRGPLDLLLRTLNLKGFEEAYPTLVDQATKDGMSYESFLYELAKIEVEQRNNRRIERLRKDSHLPADKRLDTFDFKRLPSLSRPLVAQLCEGSNLDRAENIVVFGNPGTGKTHLLCGIGHELVNKGKSVFFAQAYAVAQHLALARQELRLPQAIKKLDRFDALILDDLGCQKQGETEMEVLFALFAERYERKSLLVTSNMVFSKWDQIFGNTMRTAATIDRLVHHAQILELNAESYRASQAHERRNGKKCEKDLPEGNPPKKDA